MNEQQLIYEERLDRLATRVGRVERRLADLEEDHGAAAAAASDFANGESATAPRVPGCACDRIAEDGLLRLDAESIGAEVVALAAAGGDVVLGNKVARRVAEILLGGDENNAPFSVVYHVGGTDPHAQPFAAEIGQQIRERSLNGPGPVTLTGRAPGIVASHLLDVAEAREALAATRHELATVERQRDEAVRMADILENSRDHWTDKAAALTGQRDSLAAAVGEAVEVLETYEVSIAASSAALGHLRSGLESIGGVS